MEQDKREVDAGKTELIPDDPRGEPVRYRVPLSQNAAPVIDTLQVPALGQQQREWAEQMKQQQGQGQPGAIPRSPVAPHLQKPLASPKPGSLFLQQSVPTPTDVIEKVFDPTS